jgi:hypothetical protein
MSSATTLPAPSASQTSPHDPGMSAERRPPIGEVGRPKYAASENAD